MLTINGMEFEFDMMNARCAEAYERGFRDLTEAVKQPGESSLSAEIRRQCRLTRQLLDTVLGEGAYDRAGVDPENLDANLDAVDALVQEAARQKDNALRRAAKYSPNRAQRRGAK